MFLFAYYRDYCHMNLALIVALAPISLVGILDVIRIWSYSNVNLRATSNKYYYYYLTKKSQNNHQNKLGFNLKWKE